MRNWTELARSVLEIETEGIRAVSERLGAPIDQAVEMLRTCSGRVVLTGLGKSGLVGRKIAATFSSTGTPAFFLHPVEGAHGDLGAICGGDVLAALSYSGRTDELNAVLPAMRSLASGLIAITGQPDSPMGRMADVVLDVSVPREACAETRAPTSSTTACMALGDALAVCLMHSKSFTSDDFRRFHPGGALGQRLRLKSADIMRTESLPVISSRATQREAIAVMDAGKMGAALLMDGERLAGILTDGDVRRALAAGRLQMDASVDAVMTASPHIGNVSQSGAELLDIMERAAITILPVTDADRRLAGIVHLHDLLGKGQLRFAS